MQVAMPERRSYVGPYQLLAKIGEGGMGTVHLAKLAGPAGFNKLAVVKELRPDMARSPEFLEMFLNEARLAARLTHPNVVHTYGADEHEGCLYIAMEYLDGQPWVRVRHRLWANQSLPLALHLHVLSELLSGLHYAHELRGFDDRPLQVVHCDVSPHNVFVTYDGQVKIVDFGVARAVTSTSQEQELFVGKLSYAAPEQVRRQPLDRRADVFAVGVMLWEALAGRRFAEGKDKAEIMRRRVAGTEPRIRKVVPTVPASLAAICDRALSLDASRRFETAADFREAILDYLSGAGQRVDNVQVGKLVASAFQEERERVHRLIEQNVVRQADSAPIPVADLDQRAEPVEDTQRADLSEFASVSRLSNDDDVAHAVGQASVRRPIRREMRATHRWVIGVLAALLGLLVFAIVVFSPIEPERIATTISAVRSPSAGAAGSSLHAVRGAEALAPAPAAPAEPVKVTLRASPSSAVLFLDGRELPGNPYTLNVAVSEAIHRVVAVGPELVREERELIFNRNMEEVFDLRSGARSGISRRATARPRRERRPLPAQPEAPAVSGGEPFAATEPGGEPSAATEPGGEPSAATEPGGDLSDVRRSVRSSVKLPAPDGPAVNARPTPPSTGPAADPVAPASEPIEREPAPRRLGRLPAGEIYEEAPY